MREKNSHPFFSQLTGSAHKNFGCFGTVTVKPRNWPTPKSSLALKTLLQKTYKSLCFVVVAIVFSSTEPVPLPDRSEERRRGEDPAGERGRRVEGLLWRRVSGDSGRICHEIRGGVHLSGYDVSTSLIYGLLPHQSVIVLTGRVEGSVGRWEESWRNRGVVKMSLQQIRSRGRQSSSFIRLID